MSEPDRGAKIIATFREAPAPARILIFGMLVNRMGAFLPFFLVLYLTDRGYSAGDAGLALGAYGFGGVVGGLIGGWLTDRIGCRRTIVYSTAATGLLTGAIYHVSHLPTVVAVVALVGALGYAYRPASSALLADLVPPSRYTIVFAMYRLASSVGTAVGPLIGAALVAWSFGALFWTEALGLVALAVLAHTLLPADPAAVARAATEPAAVPGASAEPADGVAASAAPATSASGPDQPAPARGTMLRDHRFLLFLGTVFVVTLVYFQHLSTLPLHVVSSGHPTALYATLLSLNAIVVTTCELPLTKIVQRWSFRTALALNYALIGVGMALYAVPWGVVGIYVATLVWTLGEIIGAPTFFSYPAHVAPPGMRGRYLGAASAVQNLGFAIGPAVGTMLWTLTDRAFWLICGAVCMVSLLGIRGGVLPGNALSRAEPAPTATPDPAGTPEKSALEAS